ncbi:MAG: hypothetical protein AAF570_21845, partial [Bacteroidota bacterium]
MVDGRGSRGCSRDIGASFGADTTTPIFTQCTFTNNSTTYDGGAVYNYGHSGKSNPAFTNCTFTNNTASDDGGAVFNYGHTGECNPTFNNSTFTSNTATKNGGAI